MQLSSHSLLCFPGDHAKILNDVFKIKTTIYPPSIYAIIAEYEPVVTGR